MVFNYQESVSETVTLSEALAAVQANFRAVSETVTLSELLAAELDAVVGVSENVGSVAEILDSAYNAIVDTSEEVVVAEQVGAHFCGLTNTEEEVPWSDALDDDDNPNIELFDSFADVAEEVRVKTEFFTRVVASVDSAIVVRAGLFGDPVAVFVDSKVRVIAKCLDMAGAPVDAIGAQLVVRRPVGPDLTFGHHGSIGNGVVRNSAGFYFVEFVPADAGKYLFAWTVNADDSGTDAYVEGEFNVKARKVT